MELYTIDCGYFKLDGGAMFGVVPKSIWQRTNPADDDNLCTWATRLLLIKEDDRLILIDTGIGDKQDNKFLKHYHLHGDESLDKSLAKYGFHRDDISDVILTHLHFDHVGGAIKKEGDQLLPAFRNATYWSNKKHWDWATKPNDREKASFLKENISPIKESGKLKFIKEEDDIAFSNNIKISFVYGHTDAMMLPKISYRNRILLYMADLLPSIAHIPIPYVMAYDVFPMKTMVEKQRILQQALDQKYILFLEHDPAIECCTLKQTEKGIRLDGTFTLNEIKSRI